jgi:hypothetical protein
LTPATAGEHPRGRGHPPRTAAPDLWFQAADRRRRLPDWASELLALGVEAAATRPGATRLIVAVVVPTRSYAAVLIAAGAVSSYARPAALATAPSEAEQQEHFQRLLRLRPGATVTVGATRDVATVVGIDDSGPEQLIVVRQAKKKLIRKFPMRAGHLVHLQGRQLSALLVGRLKAFEDEITSGDVCTPQGRSLQELLKVDKYGRFRSGESRSAVLSAGGDLPDDLHAAMPGLVVFDGAAGFRRWRENLRVAPWVIVLDRSAPSLNEGASLIEDEYVQRNCADRAPELPIPRGTEITAFWTAR